MLTIRYFEQKAIKLVKDGLVHGSLHPYIGQEAVAVGVCSALKPDDCITSTHRGHGHGIAKGAKPDKMMAELAGKRDGYCKGVGGSMRIFDVDIGNFGCNGIVGGGIPIATGIALANKLKGIDRVTICFFGDGAVNQGAYEL